MSPPTGENRLTKQQKTGFGLLLVFGVLAVGLGLLQMRNTIYSPFVARADEDGGANVSAFFDEATRLQQIDTDQDGLNDYEELNFYETSPYLPDTDSDGIEDAVEIEQGTDPLCPEGTRCGTQADGGSAATTSPSIGPIIPVPSAADLVTGAFTGTLDDESLDVLSVSQDPAALRELLRASGNLTEEQLAGISDEALLELAREVLSGSTEGGGQ